MTHGSFDFSQPIQYEKMPLLADKFNTSLNEIRQGLGLEDETTVDLTNPVKTQLYFHIIQGDRYEVINYNANYSQPLDTKDIVGLSRIDLKTQTQEGPLALSLNRFTTPANGTLVIGWDKNDPSFV